MSYALRRQSIPALYQLGLGTVEPRAMFVTNLEKSLIGNVVLANIAQVVLSLICMLYNGLFTAMSLDYE